VIVRAKRLGLMAAMAVLAMNIWTGGPLFALWLGSRVQGSGPPSMTAVFVVAVTLVVVSLLLLKALALAEGAYADLTGRHGTRRQLPWMRSMRGDRPHSSERRLTPAEMVVMVSVMLAAAAFELWFFFLSGSSIGHG
jgi:hypothetical protein